MTRKPYIFDNFLPFEKNSAHHGLKCELFTLNKEILIYEGLRASYTSLARKLGIRERELIHIVHNSARNCAMRLDNLPYLAKLMFKIRLD